jgi:hypothetical protein
VLLQFLASPSGLALPTLRRGNRMSVDESSRHQLHERLRKVLGPEEAGTLMAHLPLGGVGELVTKDDLRRTQERLELKMDAMRHELRGEIQQVRADIHKNARTLTLSLVTVMAIMNGIVFTALKVG